MSQAVEAGVGVGVAVAVGVTVAVGVGVGGGVGVGPPIGEGPWIGTVMGAPVLKKPIVAFAAVGGVLESNRKLYNVPQRIAFAFWFWAKVSELQFRLCESEVKVHSALLYPVLPCVPSLANPGCCAGAWNP